MVKTADGNTTRKPKAERLEMKRPEMKTIIRFWQWLNGARKEKL